MTNLDKLQWQRELRDRRIVGIKKDLYGLMTVSRETAGDYSKRKEMERQDAIQAREISGGATQKLGLLHSAFRRLRRFI